MRYRVWSMGLVIIFLSVASVSLGQESTLQYFLAKTSSKDLNLSAKEKTELLQRIENAVEQTEQVHQRLVQMISGGELEIRYQEGQYWMSKLSEDQRALETARKELKVLKEKPTFLVPAIKLYKSLKDLSFNLNAYNNVPSFSALVGDLAPDLELWTDPVFYELYLVPLATSRDRDLQSKPSPKERKPPPKEKNP